jgi:hypothetical protein
MQNIKFSDEKCDNITHDNAEYWEGAPEANCDDRKYCNEEARDFVRNAKITHTDYLYHSDKTICYAETYLRHLFKFNVMLDKL